MKASLIKVSKSTIPLLFRNLSACWLIGRLTQGTIIDHPLHRFAEAASQRDGSIVRRIRIFAYFGDGDNYSLSPCFWKDTTRPDSSIHVTGL